VKKSFRPPVEWRRKLRRSTTCDPRKDPE
jgi:hypothetical protein